MINAIRLVTPNNLVLLNGLDLPLPPFMVYKFLPLLTEDGHIFVHILQYFKMYYLESKMNHAFFLFIKIT